MVNAGEALFAIPTAARLLHLCAALTMTAVAPAKALPLLLVLLHDAGESQKERNCECVMRKISEHDRLR